MITSTCLNSDETERCLAELTHWAAQPPQKLCTGSVELAIRQSVVEREKGRKERETMALVARSLARLRAEMRGKLVTTPSRSGLCVR